MCVCVQCGSRLPHNFSVSLRIKWEPPCPPHTPCRSPGDGKLLGACQGSGPPHLGFNHCIVSTRPGGHIPRPVMSAMGVSPALNNTYCYNGDCKEHSVSRPTQCLSFNLTFPFLPEM